ncbi:aspartate/glutamate racemase family protein [Marinivivus vitaminiproducens]|uniref:aspartate/glutamate racemase family protein n=1 Tax=Marinivivus vitaminiproducens TaxID=3035935 RepID=UPI002799A696|nr:aspartate/glutamate racemase family protein [Geminicoccaceae bacterium SCSIO 64248]
MTDTILVINPNSTERVTAGIDRALDPLRMTGGPSIVCHTLTEGPPGIERQADVERVTLPLARLVRERSEDCAAFVIACYSDPGLHVCREATPRPVMGIAECGLLTALTLGERIGVISILDRSIPRHLRQIRQHGLSDRFAGDLAIGLSIAELGDDDRVLARMSEVGRELRARHGADVLVMGCAGMARFKRRLGEAVGLPVVEPTQAAVTMAIGAVRLAKAQ